MTRYNRGMQGRTLAAVWLGLMTLAAAAPAAARGRERFEFEVTASGAVRQTRSASGAAAATPRPRPPVPQARPAAGARYEAGQVVVRDAAGAVLRRIPAARTAYEFVPWSVVHGGVVVFAWREPSGKPSPDDYRDVWTAVDLATGARLWRRETLWHDPPGAVPFGADSILVDDWQKVEVVELRTGTTLQTFAKADCSFSVTELGADRLLLEAGTDLYLLDRRTGASRWRLAKRGALVSWTPVGDPRRGHGVLQTTEMIYRIDAAGGRIVWRTPSSSRSPLQVVGDRIYEPTFERTSHTDAMVSLTVRRASDGLQLGKHPVQRYTSFFDLGEAVILEVAGGRVVMETTWVILD